MAEDRRAFSETSPLGSGPLHGILNVNKPAGITTMDVVRRIKRASGQKRVGHGGTLDPLATGVVPIFFGQATRMMEYLVDGSKEYRSLIVLGVETDTYDASGRVTRRKDASDVTRQDVEQVLKLFEGTIDQVPPMYSALKQRGKRLYDLARAGIEVERKPRRVKVLELRLMEWAPPHLDLMISCGRGFYVRSLAHDLGQALGCGGNLKTLVRLRAGPFTIADALDLEAAVRVFAEGDWQNYLHSPDTVVGHLPVAVVGSGLEEMIRNGRAVPDNGSLPITSSGQQCRVYGIDGRFVAIMSFDATLGQWQPERVFSINATE